MQTQNPFLLIEIRHYHDAFDFDAAHAKCVTFTFDRERILILRRANNGQFFGFNRRNLARRFVQAVRDRAQQFANALPRRRRDRERINLAFRHRFVHARPLRLRVRQIELVQRDDLRLVREARTVLREFAIDRLVRGERIIARAVEQVNQDARALDVAQKFIAETRAQVRAFDQTGNIRENQVAVVNHRDAEIRDQRSERVIRDLGARGSHRRQQGGFAGIRQTDDADIREQFQFERDPTLRPWFAFLGPARRLIRGTRERGIAAPAAPAAREDHARVRVHQIADQFAGFSIAHEGPARHINQQIIRAFTMLIFALTMPARFGFEMGAFAETQQRIETRVDDDDHIAAVAAMPAIGSTAGNVLFAAETHTSVAAIAGLHENFRFIKEKGFFTH